MKVRSIYLEDDEFQMIIDALCDYVIALQDDYSNNPTDALWSEIKKARDLGYSIESFCCNNSDVYIF